MSVFDQLVAFGKEHPIQAALYASLFTWGLTALGASLVFFFKKMNRAVLDGMLGFTGGVMVAASFWSLLSPAIENSPGEGFIKTTLLVLAITLHNIPEGLAVGVLFGAASTLVGVEQTEMIIAAISLAIGIGIQNFPEGFAVAMPLRRQGISRLKSFWYGQLSAIVEPVAAVLGALAVSFFTPILPYALAFAAGAMIFVVVEEVIPETQRDKYTDIATLGFIGGFIVMMCLDVGLG